MKAIVGKKMVNSLFKLILIDSRKSFKSRLIF